jgi:3-methyladenine DNA glycosylase AlkD
MPAKVKKSSSKTAGKKTERPIAPQVKDVVAWLERTGSKKGRDAMARYAIPSDKAYGVGVGAMQKYAQGLGQNHELALALWKVDRYETRMLTMFLAEPERVTAAQMDRWVDDFDNWAICDTACFKLFDQTAHAWLKVEQWARRKEEFVVRTAFALLWSLTVHDRDAHDEQFIHGLALIERAATDERNFVKKAVDMALRATGKRNRALNLAAVDVARRLATSPDATAKWIGKHALRELSSPSVTRRLSR